MSKGAVGLTAGYWPDDIYRYLAVPGLSLDEALVTRPARRRGDQLALARGETTIVYRQLAQDVDRAAGLFRASLGAGANRVALAVHDELELARLWLGGLRARCLVALLEPRAGREALAERLAAFRPDLVLADGSVASELTAAGQEGWRVVSAQDFWQGQPGRASAGRLDLRAPATALLGPNGRFVYHSHASLVAWAVSWSAFVPLTEESTVLSLEPLTRWGGLVAALPVLFRGGACVFAASHEPAALAAVIQERHPSYLLLSLPSAVALVVRDHPPLRHALQQGVQGVFVTVERPFSVRERRRLEAAFGVPVLTLLGSVVAGPVAASHPTWYLEEAVGIPVTNVDLWPLHPGTREALAVPWEAIEFGEVGARSPMTAVDFETPEDRAAYLTDEWVRLGVVATMDPNGLFYLRS